MRSTTFRILHISSPLSWRGGEQQLYYLFSNINQYASAEIAQWVYCPEGSELSKKVSKDQVLTYVKRGGFDVLAARKLSKLCADLNIDVVHAHDAHSHTTAVLADLLFGNKASIIVSRRVDFEIGKSWWSRFKYNYSSIKYIVCVSDAIKEIVKKGISKNPERVVTVHSGIDPNRIHSRRTNILRKELGLSENDVLIGNVAALADHKDYFTFLDAVNILRADQRFRFVVIGGGPMEEQIKAYANELGLQDEVHFVGHRKDIPQILKDLDVFLFTSKTEGLGTSVLDAFAAEVPIVSTNAGGIPEMVEHLRTGLICNVGDSKTLAINVLRLVDDLPLLKTLIKNAKERLQDFTHISTFNKTLKLYQILQKK